MAHELILLSPYRYPGQTALTLANEDMASWLNGFSVLWHPALLWTAKGPPRVEAQYDHEQPKAGCVYALPETPPLFLPDDWNERVKAAGAIAFRAGVDRATTLAKLATALHETGDGFFGWLGGLDLPKEQITPFFGLGFGYLLLGTLAEAMEHENLLDDPAFWNDVQSAIAALAGLPYSKVVESSMPASASDEAGLYPPHEADSQSQDMDGGENVPVTAQASEPHDSGENDGMSGIAPPVDWRTELQAAAARLLSAREVLYPVTIHLLDISFLESKDMEHGWPASFELGIACNFLASGQALEALSEIQPDKLRALRDKVGQNLAEICGGGYLEREDPLLPIDSQLWNLRKGLAVSSELLGAEVKVFARKRFGFHPQLPLLLTTNGLQRALLLTFDESSAVPQYSSSVVSWPSPDGKQVDAYVRAPHAADKAETYFNLAHYLFKTTREDHVATLALMHNGAAPPWHCDMMELARLAPVLGTWQTFSQYFQDVTPGEFPSALSVDDFHFDFLSERISAQNPAPVSAFAQHVRTRRRIDACWTYAALHRSLAGTLDRLQANAELEALENAFEKDGPASTARSLPELEQRITWVLAERLQARAASDRPGTLLLNPCAYARRLALELEGAGAPLPVSGIVKACQLDGSTLRAVVEVPALGFAWIPREGPPGTPPMIARMRLGDPQTLTIRNEFFEVEVDPATGGLRAIRDHKTRLNRLGQRLVFNPGSTMAANTVKVTKTGPALAEIVSEGVLLGEQSQTLATFRQRFRVWLGRPLLELRIDIQPQQPPAGYPWHAYFGSRFAWRDERATMLRGLGGASHLTTHTRPQTPDFIELRLGRQSTVVFPGGLPFHQRHEGRMVDMILITEGERATTFDLGIALDREAPMLTAQGFVSPVAMVPTTKGPPHVGDSGWLFHLDVPNLLLTRMVPGVMEPTAEAAETKSEPRDAVTARLLECGGHSGQAEFRCARNPKRAVLLDGRGQFLLEAHPTGDAVMLEVTPNDLVHVQVEF